MKAERKRYGLRWVGITFAIGLLIDVGYCVYIFNHFGDGLD